MILLGIIHVTSVDTCTLITGYNLNELVELTCYKTLKYEHNYLCILLTTEL